MLKGIAAGSRSKLNVWIVAIALAAAVIRVAFGIWPFSMKPVGEEGNFLIPVHVSIEQPQSNSSEIQDGDDVWPKTPVPKRDPNYNPERPAWLTADLTEKAPIAGKVAYLTFDDGPSSMTPRVLDVLGKMGVPATFYTVYHSDASVRGYFKQIVDSGCELALHAYLHDPSVIYQSPEIYLDDYHKMNNFLFEVAGIHTKQVRFPGGSSQTVSNPTVFWEVMKAAQSNGLVWNDWNVSSGDASPQSHTAEWVYNNIFPSALQYDNPVILMHDVPSNERTLEALPWIIKTLRANGYTFDVTANISEPVQHRNPTRDPAPHSSSNSGSGRSGKGDSSGASGSSEQAGQSGPSNQGGQVAPSDQGASSGDSSESTSDSAPSESPSGSESSDSSVSQSSSSSSEESVTE